MALDSTLDDMPESAANALHFGRLNTGKTRSPFPQVRCLYLAEVGTHAVIDAVFAPSQVAEQRMAPALGRSLESVMLVLCDRNFPFTEWIAVVQQRSHLLARLSSDRFR